MGMVRNKPTFGLASTDEEARKAAIALLEKANLAVRRRHEAGANGGLPYSVMSRSLVSGRKKKPMITVSEAKMIGYQRPA